MADSRRLKRRSKGEKVAKNSEYLSKPRDYRRWRFEGCLPTVRWESGAVVHYVYNPTTVHYLKPYLLPWGYYNYFVFYVCTYSFVIPPTTHPEAAPSSSHPSTSQRPPNRASPTNEDTEQASPTAPSSSIIIMITRISIVAGRHR